MQIDRVEMVEKGLTIEQASELLGVSKDTVRRKIKKGELSAVKRIGVYGEQFFIDESEINVATEIRDVIPVVRNLSLQDFSNALESALCNAIAPLQQQIESLATENKALMNELQSIKQEQERIEQNKQTRDAELMQNIRLIQEQQKKPWWKKILGG